MHEQAKSRGPGGDRDVDSGVVEVPRTLSKGGSAGDPPGHTRARALDAGRVVIQYRPFTIDIVDGPEAGWSGRFDERCIEIGSTLDCDLTLHDSTVSRRHCRIEVTAEGYRLVDQGSRNGTRVDGCAVEAVRLRPGAVVQLGATRLRFGLADRQLEMHLLDGTRFPTLTGRSEAMRHLFAQLDRHAVERSPLLLEGESGVGKALIAQAVHDVSGRVDGPFEELDCAAVLESQAEIELFGYDGDDGMYARADGGTLVLLEVGSLPESSQRRLVRLLERRRFRPRRMSRRSDADVRVVATSSEDLVRLVNRGTFRKDLYHCLKTGRVRVPPLRHRRDDVPLLADRFFAARPGPERPSLSAFERLRDYDWPGNVRELRNYVEHGVLVAQDVSELPFFERVTHSLQVTPGLPPAVLEGAPAGERGRDGTLLPEGVPLPPYRDAKRDLVDRWEVAYCRRIVQAHGGNVSAAARASGLHRKSLEYLLQKHGIRRGEG